MTRSGNAKVLTSPVWRISIGTQGEVYCYMLLHYSRLQALPDDELIREVKASVARPFRELLLFDLMFYNGVPLTLAQGVYLISQPLSSKIQPHTEPTEFLYIGKCDRRSFAERITSHLAWGPHAILATLMRNLTKPGHFAGYVEALGFVSNCGLRLIEFERRDILKSDVLKFEQRLQRLLRPAVNSVRRGRVTA